MLPAFLHETLLAKGHFLFLLISYSLSNGLQKCRKRHTRGLAFLTLLTVTNEKISNCLKKLSKAPTYNIECLVKLHPNSIFSLIFFQLLPEHVLKQKFNAAFTHAGLRTRYRTESL